MAMTLWIHTLDGRNRSQESTDHSLMYGAADELDSACDHLGVPRISSFFDTTDFDYNMSDEIEDIAYDEDPALDEESGLPYGIDDMLWFETSRGLASLAALRLHISGPWKPELDQDDRALLLKELDDCIATLKGRPVQSEMFHLAVMM